MRTQHVRIFDADPHSSKRWDLSHGLCLVDLASILLDPELLKIVIRAVVSRKSVYLVASLGTHDSS